MENSRISRLSQKQYIRLLEHHFDFTMRYRKVYLEPEIEPIEKSILDHREKLSVRYPKTVLISVLIYSFIYALAMGIVILFVVNEIVKYSVDYSPLNVLALSAVFFIGRVRLKFFEND